MTQQPEVSTSRFVSYNSQMRRLAASLASALLLLAPDAFASKIPQHLFEEMNLKSRYTLIPLESNSSVDRWLHFFSVSNRDRFDRFMERGSLYKQLIQKILQEEGVPAELYYLAMVESGFARQARSHASAVGVWQFIAPTARRYGLRVDKEVDERLDLIRSTRAAARYLKDLKNEFGSWYLAMASYNCGENKVRTAIRRHRTRDYWKLVRLGALPNETSNYVPKFQAAMQIARSPERFGFEKKTTYRFPRYEAVKVAGRVPLRYVAHQHRVSEETLRAFNLHLINAQTPRTSHGYEVWIPSKQARK
jgi:membrane-bound lytic murein transglycosylase D